MSPNRSLPNTIYGYRLFLGSIPIDVHISDLKTHHTTFSNMGFSTTEFGAIISKKPDILSSANELVIENLLFWQQQFSDKNDFMLHLSTYPTSCFHCIDFGYQQNRQKISDMLQENIGINTRVVVRLVTATPDFFHHSPSTIEKHIGKLKYI